MMRLFKIFAPLRLSTLTATSLISSTFTGGEGDVVTTTNLVTVTMDAAKSVTAAFALKT